MGNLDPSDKEVSLLSNMFLESAKQKGTEVVLSPIDKDNTDRTFQNDPEYAYLEDEDVNIILDERPDIKTLKSLNWYNEEDDLLPLLAYLSVKDIDEEYREVLKGAKVKVPFKLVGSDMVQKYIIEEVKFSKYYVWVCKLVPDREEPPFEDDVSENVGQDSDFRFLKVDK